MSTGNVTRLDGWEVVCVDGHGVYAIDPTPFADAGEVAEAVRSEDT